MNFPLFAFCRLHLDRFHRFYSLCHDDIFQSNLGSNMRTMSMVVNVFFFIYTLTLSLPLSLSVSLSFSLSQLNM